MRTFAFALALAGCGSSTVTTERSPQLTIDCVATWNAKEVSLNFKGNHPDYDPDYGELWLHDKPTQQLRYFTDGNQLRMWLEHGKRIVETKFKLVTTEDSKFVSKYELRLDQPVAGARVFEGALLKSTRCEPRAN